MKHQDTSPIPLMKHQDTQVVNPQVEDIQVVRATGLWITKPEQDNHER